MATAVEFSEPQSIELDSSLPNPASGFLSSGSQIDQLSSVPETGLLSYGSESSSRSSSKRSRAANALVDIVQESDFIEEKKEGALEKEEEDEEEEVEYEVDKETKMMTLYDSEFENLLLDDRDELCKELLQNQPYEDVSNLPRPTEENTVGYDEKFSETAGFDMPRYKVNAPFLVQPANTSEKNLDFLVLCAKVVVKHENKRRLQCNEEQGKSLSDLKLTGIIKAMSRDTNLRDYWFTIRVKGMEDNKPVEKVYEANVSLMSPLEKTYFQIFRVKGNC